MSSDYKEWYKSPSQLAGYNECPRKYYGRYVAQQRAQDEQAAFLDSGKLVHRVLEIAAQTRIDSGTRDKKVTKKELLGYLEKAAKEEPKKQWMKPTNITPEIIEGAAKVIGLCWKSMNFTHTIFVERDFSIPIGAITDPDGKVAIEDAGLSGVIDRIDEIGDRIKIVDYKSGWSVMSRGEAEVDPQVNYYLVVGAELFPGRPIDLELRYLNRGVRVGPIHYSPERKEWLLNSYVKPILTRMATWKKWPETPGAPQCYSCYRKAACMSFSKLIKGTLATVTADMGKNLELYERLTTIEGNVERIKKPLKELLNAACEKQDDGEIFAGNHRCRLIFRNKTEYNDIRRSATEAAKAILKRRQPPAPPVAPPEGLEDLKKAYTALAERNARLESASIEAATAFEIACKIGKAQSGLIDEFVETLPEEVTLEVSQAFEATATNGGYYSLEVERLPIPFHDPKPTEAEIELAAAQEAEQKLLPKGALPLLDDSHELKQPPAPVQPEAPPATIAFKVPDEQALKGDVDVVAGTAEVGSAGVSVTLDSVPPKITGGTGGNTSGDPAVLLGDVKAEPANPPKSAAANGSLFPDADKPVWAQPDCKACGGTGISSKGGPCSPCTARAQRAGTAK